MEYSEEPADKGIDLSGYAANYLGMINDVFEKEGKHYLTLWYSFIINSLIEPKLLEPESAMSGDGYPGPVFLSLQKFITGDIL